MNIQAKVEANVEAGYSKSYATYKNAAKAVENYECQLDLELDAMIIALPSGRFSLAIYVRPNSGIDQMKIVHGTKGVLVFN